MCEDKKNQLLKSIYVNEVPDKWWFINTNYHNLLTTGELLPKSPLFLK